jgi:hypothetical protein
VGPRSEKCASQRSSRHGSGGTQQHEPYRVEHDLEILQFVDQRYAAIFQCPVDRGISRGSSEKDDPVAQVRGAGHQHIIEIDAVQLRHEEIAHHRRDARIVGYCLEGASPGIGFANCESTPLENLPQGGSDCALVVHQEDCGHEVGANLGRDRPALQE